MKLFVPTFINYWQNKCISLVILLFVISGNTSAQNEFITRWDLSLSPGSGPNQIRFFTLNASGPINFTWHELPSGASGNGSIPTASSLSIYTLTGLPAGAIIELRLESTYLSRFAINDSADRSRLIRVVQWGNAQWSSFDNMFFGANNLRISALDQPVLTWCTSMVNAFRDCSSINDTTITNINHWDISKVTNMSGMFWGSNFNQNIAGWNVSNVINMSNMFRSITTFNQNIAAWDVSNVTNMSGMFRSAAAFNQNIASWDVSNVTNMSGMFQSAVAFNQDISNWNVYNVTNLSNMFLGATAFNQSLARWLLHPTVNILGMLNSCGMSCANYSATLIGWAATTTAVGRQLGASGRQYSSNSDWARVRLINTLGWNISGANSNTGTCGLAVYYSKSTGDLNDTATWGINTDGSGTSPTNFSTDNQIFIITNRSVATINADWSVSGNNTLVILGDSITNVSFNTGNFVISGNYKLAPNSTLNISSNTTTDLRIVCDTLSTLEFSGSGSQIISTPTEGIHVFNLIISGNRNGGSIDITNARFNIRRAFDITATNVSAWTTTGSIINYCGTGSQTIITGPSGFNYHNLYITGARTSSPTITLSSGTIYVQGKALFGATGSFNWATAGNTIEYNGSGSQVIAGFQYENLTISGTRTDTPTITLEPNKNIRIRNQFNISITGNVIWENAFSTITYNGTGSQTIITGPPGFNYYNLTITGARTGSPTITLQSGTIFINNTFVNNPSGVGSWVTTDNDINFNGTGAQNIAPSTSGFSYRNLIISNNRNFQAITFPGGTIRVTNEIIIIATNIGSMIFNPTNTIEYNGNNNQSVIDLPYSNLTISGSSGTKTLAGNITVNGTLTLNRSLHIGANTLTLNGNFTRSGSNVLIADGTTSSLVIGGTSPSITLFFSQTTPGITNRLNNLTINRPSQTVTLGNAMQIRGTLTPTAGILNTGNNLLTLVSDTNQTARVAQGPAAGGYITGTQIVQRFVPMLASPGPSNNYGRRWRFISSPVHNRTVNDWRQETFITGPGTGNTVGSQNSNGFDATASNSPSLFSYNESTLGTNNLGWVSPTNVNDTLATGLGYRLFIRGDRSDLARIGPSATTTPANSVTLDVRGDTIHQGPITMPVTYTTSSAGDNHDGWNLLGNPYPCPIDWNALHDAGRTGSGPYYSGTDYANLLPTAWVWNPITNSYTAYNALSDVGTGSGDFATAGIIASGQAFWVKAGTSPSLTLRELHKAVTNVTGLFKNNSSFKLELRLDDFNRDEMAVKYVAGTTALFDSYDAHKMPTAVGISTWGDDNIDLTINCRPPVTNVNDTIRLNVTVPASGNYTMIFKNSQELAIQQYVSLIDVYTNTVTDMLSHNTYTFTADISQPLSYGKNRFYIVISQNQPLPIEVLNLKARAISKQQVEVSWKSASEVNFSHYEVEKSTDGSSYTAITKVNGTGATQYLAYDNAPEALNYYRLKLVDKDGTYRHTHSVVVRMEDANATQPVVYPNPAPGFFTVSVPQPANYEIVDMNGRTVAIGHISKEQFFDGLNRGVYMIKLHHENGKDEGVKIIIE